MSKKVALICLVLVGLGTMPLMLGRIDKNPYHNIFSDSAGYFWYLPAFFAADDFKTYPPGSANMRVNDEGETVNKYTCGVAYFQLPGYLIVSTITGEGDRVESTIKPYAFAVGLTGYLVAFIGLGFLMFWLTRFFSPAIALGTVLLTLYGTNMFYYTFWEMGMSHVYSFTLFAMLLWLCPRLYERPSWGKAALAGVLVGWISLIRPTNVVVLLLLVFYGVESRADLSARIQFYRQHLGKLLLATLAGFLIAFPQLLYWKALTGNWITYSYSGEGFIYWRAPRILAVLFDTQNGLFLYSPVVLLTVAGLVITAWRNQYQGRINLLIFVLITYTFASWWAWWYGGAFGHRCYIEFYAFLAPGLAYMLHLISKARLPLRGLSYAVLGFFLFYSIKMAFLYRELGASWDGPDWRWSSEKIQWVWSHLFVF